MLKVRLCGVSESMEEVGRIAQYQSSDAGLIVVGGAGILAHI
jgi:hypothetical protein